MDNGHTLFLILGRTSSGKDSLVNEFCKRTGAKKLISYTTRPRRVNEEDTHIFVTDADYERIKEQGQVAAFTQIGNVKYWCTFDQLMDSDVYIIDYLGVMWLRSLNIPNIKMVSVFINTPYDVRKYRALNERKDNEDKFNDRNLAERDQFLTMLSKADFDYSIKNIDFEKAYSVFEVIAKIENIGGNK